VSEPARAFILDRFKTNGAKKRGGGLERSDLQLPSEGARPVHDRHPRSGTPGDAQRGRARLHERALVEA
jgi:hypothetical protein